MPKCNTDLKPWVELIRQYSLLSVQEERQLLVAKTSGDIAARDKLVLHNLRLVVYLARGHARRIDVEMDDVISCGNIGLQHAVDKFDVELYPDYRLSTYATYWILQSISRYLRARHLIHVPDHMHRAFVSTANYEEIDIPHKDKALLALKADYKPRYNTDNGDDDDSPLDKLETPDASEQIEAADLHADGMRKIGGLLKRIPARERLAIELRYMKGLTMDGVGAGLGVTKERARQVLISAVRNLRKQADVEQVGYSTDD